MEQTLRLFVGAVHLEPHLDRPLAGLEDSRPQTEEMLEGSHRLYEGQVLAQAPLVVQDDPVQRYEGLRLHQLQILHVTGEVLLLGPGDEAGGGGEDVVPGDGRPHAQQAGGRHDLDHPGVLGGGRFLYSPS